MAEQGEHGISWTDATWNPIRGCSMARGSETGGCLNCYAARQAVRHSGPGRPYEGLARMTSSGPRWTGEVRLVPEHLEDPLHWTRPRRVFVNSMSDLWHENLDDTDIDQVFAVMAMAPQHQFQVLTKRACRLPAYLASHSTPGHILTQTWHLGATEKDLPAWPLPNVWLAVSCEDQETAEARIPLLLQTPAAVRWISAEPLLGPIDLSPWLRPCVRYGCTSHQSLDWVVVGGESGPDARPMNPDWARDLRDQCQAAGVAFHFKQHGEWCDYTTMVRGNLRYTKTHDWPDTGDGYHRSFRVGKRAAGRLLDGREWNQYPEAAP